MLDRREHDARPHQGRRVRAMSDKLDRCGNLEVIEVCSDKDVARIGRRGSKAQSDGHSRVQSQPPGFSRLSDGRLFNQGEAMSLSNFRA